MDFNLNYLTSGIGIPLIFQHGLGADALQTQHLFSGLPGIKLISMDCPGHGGTVLPAGYNPTFDNYTDDLLRLMDFLNIEKTIVGGISMGSGISLNLALRYPDRVKALILVRPAWLDQGSPDNLQILLDVVKYVNRPDGQQIFKNTVDFQKIQSALPNAAASILGLFSRAQGDATESVLTNMVKDKPFEDLSDLDRIEQPTLILVNDQDPLHPFEFGEQIERFLSNGRIEYVLSRYVDDARHRLEVRDIVSSFIRKIM